MDLILDIGGTKTRIGLVSENGKLLETSIFPTEKKYQEGLENVFAFIRLRDIRVENIVAGLPGVLNLDKGSLFSAPNLNGWIGKSIRADLIKETGASVFLENDAALAGLGEAVYGAGRDQLIISYLTIGTGIGGARIVNKKIDEKAYGFEPGHTAVIANLSLPKGKQSLVTFEGLASGRSIEKMFGDVPENITDSKIWKKIIKNISIGIANTVFYWSPELIVLGGGVTHSENFNVELLKSEVKKVVGKTYPTVPEIKKSILGDFSGIWGGLAYLRDNL